MNFYILLRASLKEFARDRTTLSFTIIVPLLLVVFFGFAFSSPSSKLGVGLVYSRDSAAPHQNAVLSDLSRSADISVHRGSRRAELGDLHDGSIDAVVILRKGQTRILYDRGNGQLTLAVQALATRIRAINKQGVVAAGSASTARVEVAGIFPNSRLDYVVPGILATAIMWLGIFSAIPLVQQREQQVLRRFAVTPVSRSRLVLAQITGRLFISLCQAAFVLLAARLLFGVAIGSQLGSTPGALAVIAALVLLGALGFVAIGYAVAALSSTQSSAHAWAQLLTMPMLLFAGVFFPITLFPEFLKPLTAILPLTYLADALRQTAMSGQHFVPLGVDLFVLACWVVAPLALAIRYFRWT